MSAAVTPDSSSIQASYNSKETVQETACMLQLPAADMHVFIRQHGLHSSAIPKCIVLVCGAAGSELTKKDS